MKHFYTKYFHKLWVLCLCLSVLPCSMAYANRVEVTKSYGSSIASQLSTVVNGDTIIIKGDTLQDGNPFGAPNDWWDMNTPLGGKNFVLVLETNNRSVPGWQMNGLNVTSLIFPNVEIFKNGAFFGAPNLVSVYAPNAKVLEHNVFYQCPLLAIVELPEVHTMESNVFNQCPNLTTIDFPNLQTMGDNVFFQCLNLTSAKLPKVVSIGNQALQYCTSLTDVNVSNAVMIGNNAFSGCTGLTSINLPKAVTIGNSAFNLCTSLTDITFPNVQTIGDYAFIGTNLPSVILPNVQSIGNYAFQNCASITTLSIPKITTIQEGTFDGCTGLTNLYMPYVQTLGNWTFGNCTNLEFVFLHNLSSFGQWTFTNCPALKYMELGNNPPAYTVSGFGGSTGAVLIVVPDTNAYGPAPLVDPPYSAGSEAHLKKVSTEKRIFNYESPETLIPGRVPNPLLAGTYVWKKDGYPIANATGSSYTPDSPGRYTLEFTHGGTVTLLSVYLAKDAFDLYGSHTRYEDCSYTLVLTFTPSANDRTITVQSLGTGASYVADVNSGLTFENGLTYKLPKNKTMLEIPYEVVEGMSENNEVQFMWQSSDNSIIDYTDEFTLYAKHTITYRYIRPTSGYAGLLEVNITGGSLYMQRSIDGGRSWQWARDTITGAPIPFSKSQIYNLQESSYLLFRQPNICSDYDVISLYNSEESDTILRQVQIPPVTQAESSVAEGDYFVNSRNNFVFTLTNVKSDYVPYISTSRTLVPDSEGVLVDRLSEGTYKITILCIQESIVVSIDFAVGNEQIEDVNVWSSDGMLHLQTAESGNALVYTLSGVFVQNVRLSAGENISLPLAKGCYIIAIGKKTYKVVL